MPAEFDDRMLRQLNTLIEVTNVINSSLDTTRIREMVIEAATRLLGAEAGSLLLVDREDGKLFFEVAIGDKSREVKSFRLPRGAGIAGWVAEHAQPVLSNNVAADARFFPGVDAESGFITRNMICVPVMVKDRLIGVLEAINKASGDFTEDDTTILYALANQVAIAIENAQLYQASITDSLTGLYHHQYFQVRLREELERAKRYKTSLAIGIIDIDLFKKVNDARGHLAGDCVLRGMASLLKRQMRLSDSVARYGGEEFAIILPRVDLSSVRVIGERLRKDVESADFDGVKITISSGFCYFDGNDMGFTEARFIDAADHVLYLAKTLGRNRVEVISASVERAPAS